MVRWQTRYPKKANQIQHLKQTKTYIKMNVFEIINEMTRNLGKSLIEEEERGEKEGKGKGEKGREGDGGGKERNGVLNQTGE